MTYRRRYGTLHAAICDGYRPYDWAPHIIILWKEVSTIVGKGYVWAEVHLR